MRDETYNTLTLSNFRDKLVDPALFRHMLVEFCIYYFLKNKTRKKEKTLTNKQTKKLN